MTDPISFWSGLTTGWAYSPVYRDISNVKHAIFGTVTSMIAKQNGKKILGILGGMGPLASAEFLKTLYQYSINECEQESPIVVMSSDPTFPDRTEAFLKGEDDVLFKRFTEALHRLNELGPSRIVICCITMHYLLPRLPSDLRKQIISLLDVIFDNVIKVQKKHLLICTNGTRKLGLFQSHKHWELAKDYIVFPDENDQDMIHRMIYQVLKRNGDLKEAYPFLESLLVKYEVDSFIAGCTEIHLLAKHFQASRSSDCSADHQKGYSCVDPLMIIAKDVAEDIGHKFR